MEKTTRKIKNSTSKESNTGYKGIRYRKDIRKFTAYLSFRSPVNKKPKHIVIGNHDTIADALLLREEFINSLF